MEGVGWYYDHSQGKHILAHNLVSSHYVTGKFNVPLNLGIHMRKTDIGDKKGFETKVEIAKELAEKAVGYCSPIDIIAFDSWYVSEKLTSFLKEKGIEAYVSEEKGDHLVLSDDSKTDVSLSEFAKTIPTERFEPVEVYTSFLGEKRTSMAFCTFGEEVRLVVSYKDGAKEPPFHISNKGYIETPSRTLGLTSPR